MDTSTQGLTQEHAKRLLLQYGKNELKDDTGPTPLLIFFSQFKSILILLLIVAAIASLTLNDVVDGLLILGIVFLNATFGFIQEYKAQKSIQALKKLTVAQVRVKRGGEELEIPSTMLVPGDIIVLEEGNKIPADCILVESVHFEVNEAALTGESLPVQKSLLNVEESHIFLGTTVTKGRALARVVTTGMQTKFGKIAASLAKMPEEQTTTQKRLATLGTQLGFLALAASCIVFALGYLRGQPVIELLLTSISLAVAAVPEGLPAIITVTLAVGMQRMAKKKAILRKLAAIESLGSTTLIATDKTGTLTKNEMRVSKAWYEGEKTLQQLLKVGVLCNNAQLIYKHGHDSFDVLGDTTEGALLLFAQKHGVIEDKEKKQGTLVEEFPFDPTIKIMSIVWKQGKELQLLTKGAPESLLERSSKILINGKVHALTDEKRVQIEKEFTSFAKHGLRIIALTSKDIHAKPSNRVSAEKDLTFLGFVGISDPPREEVASAIEMARKAGIKTVMITGDNELTANAIATSIGLIQENEEIITGKQLQELSETELLVKLDKIRVFARTTPDQKVYIVQLFQKLGHIVAVTGDGVNDALALKQAHVGVAMGITGTDVAKEAADMVITDDNYATIVTAVYEGRIIFNNIKSTIKYLIGSNLGEVVITVITVALGWPLIFTPIHLLYINLVSDGLPALALALNTTSNANIQTSKPSRLQTFDRFDAWWFVEVNIATVLVTLAAFLIGSTTSIQTGRTLAFTTFIFAQTLVLLDVWLAQRSVLSTSLVSSNVFLAAFLLPIGMQFALLYFTPLTQLFSLAPLSTHHVLLAFILAGILLLVSESRKAFGKKLFYN